MTATATIFDELTSRWPDRFTDEELADLAPRLDPYNHGDAVKAMEQHKARSKFKPTWAELLSLLNVITASNAATLPHRPVPEPSFPQVLADRYQTSPAAAVLLYRRAEWAKYAEDAVERMRDMRPGPELDMLDAQFRGARVRAVMGAKSGLIAAGADPAWAADVAELVTAEQYRFDRALDDIGRNGIRQPEQRQRTRVVGRPIFGSVHDIFRTVPPLAPGDANRRRCWRSRRTPRPSWPPGGPQPRRTCRVAPKAIPA